MDGRIYPYGGNLSSPSIAGQVGRRPLPAEGENFFESILHRSPGTYGYVALLGLKSSDPARVLQSVKKGLSFKALEHFQRNLSLSLNQLTQIVQIAPTTLTRRRLKGRLTPEESDRLMRVTRLFAKALELHEGDGMAVWKWLSNSQTALGGASPLEVAKTEVGAREVEALIDRLEQGVFS